MKVAQNPVAMQPALNTGWPPGLHMPLMGNEHSGMGPYWQQSFGPGVCVGVSVGVAVAVGVSDGVRVTQKRLSESHTALGTVSQPAQSPCFPGNAQSPC